MLTPSSYFDALFFVPLKRRLYRPGVIALMKLLSLSGCFSLWALLAQANEPLANAPSGGHLLRQEQGKNRPFRIGADSSISSSFNIVRAIATSISKPYGARECDQGGSCGVDGLIAVSQTVEGDETVLGLILSGKLEAGIVRPDVYSYSAREEVEKLKAIYGYSLRSIASLYPQYLQIVARVGSGIRHIEELKGKTVAAGLLNQGIEPLLDVLLAEMGLAKKDLNILHMSDSDAYLEMIEGRLDALILIDSAPSPLINLMAGRGQILLISLPKKYRNALVEKTGVFKEQRIPAGSYKAIPPVQTVATKAQLMVRSDLGHELIYEITKALWHESSIKRINSRGELFKGIAPRPASFDLVVPLHTGAARYYTDIIRLKRSGKRRRQ